MENDVQDLARQVLLLSRNTLLVNLRFLDAALSQFRFAPGPLPMPDGSFAVIPIGTDGKKLFYDPRQILLRYRAEKEASVRDYLHLVMHCVFQHMYIHSLIDQPIWDLACDIAVEEVINGLHLPCTESKRQAGQAKVLEGLRKELKQVTAEKVYRWYLDHPPKNLEALAGLFQGDDHTPWYLPPKVQQLIAQGGAGSGKEGQSGREDRPNGGGSGGNSSGDSPDNNGGGFSEMEAVWKDVARRMQMDLETFSKMQGNQAGSLTQNLQAVNRERYDYTEFLKKFAVRGEVMKINPDEFDYIFYTYGLKLYEKMPLIEPLEYKEVRRIREFVIAIDTSGSVAGELVQKFVQKTYNVLKSTESFFSKINVHIIQCDAKIQEDIKITSQEEFDAYLKEMQIKGLGGTDFRPVFAYVDKLRREKEFQNLKGLIYFTDGCGAFPERKPDYDAAFVFVEDEYNNPNVPPWAIKLVLQKDEV